MLTTAAMLDNLVEKVDKCALMSSPYVLFAYNWDRESCPLYGVDRWPRNRGFLSTIPKNDAVGTKVSVRHRRGGHSSEVGVKRGSTVYCSLKIGS